MVHGTARVLVVEDDRKLANAISAGISAEGYLVTLASSAEEGFFLLHREQPDLVILDITLPNRSGIDPSETDTSRNYRRARHDADFSQLRRRQG